MLANAVSVSQVVEMLPWTVLDWLGVLPKFDRVYCCRMCSTRGMFCNPI